MPRVCIVCTDRGQGITRLNLLPYLVCFLSQTIEAPKIRNGTVGFTNTQKEKQKRMIVSKIEIKLQFPYLLPAQYEHHTTADTH